MLDVSWLDVLISHYEDSGPVVLPHDTLLSHGDTLVHVVSCHNALQHLGAFLQRQEPAFEVWLMFGGDIRINILKYNFRGLLNPLTQQRAL